MNRLSTRHCSTAACRNVAACAEARRGDVSTRQLFASFLKADRNNSAV